jgi:hypothetical protein
MLKLRKTQKLTFPQTCMTANFYDAACDYPSESFGQVARRLPGAGGFPPTKNSASFKRKCRQAFDLGRKE